MLLGEIRVNMRFLDDDPTLLWTCRWMVPHHANMGGRTATM